ncbi:Non-receptor tyrosine kinase spore lysis A [Fasciola hepatica]|uniref:Non-receptor tyrosine kinase spore lysis A n=1 Tax=Fasciola hepatica TaxID=6192 RepID=A0A4E0R5G3_FASHE|nr:Non-receptor tyrosine kinase spore lysis A [Fasciola hepatica]
MRIEDLLDSELQMNCDHFSEQSYFTVQQAFELLGSTQTTFAQLHMHYIASIQRRTLTIVQSFVPPIDKDSEQSCASRDYSELCLQTGSVCRSSGFSSLEPGSDVDSHQSPRNSGSRHDLMRSRVNRPNGNFGRNSDISDEEEDEGDVIENGLRTDRNDERSTRAADSNDNQSQLFRQWHDYVASKLTASRPRIWTEVSGRVEAILRCVGQFATEMQFDQISSVLKTVNHLVTIGEEFCGSLSTDLQEVLRTSIYKFFRDFHRKHMERLKMFLESETWESCPVKSSFTVMDLQEYRALINLLQNSEPKKQVTTMPLDHNSPRSLTSQLPTVSEKRLFDAPYEEHQFPVPADSTTPGSQSMDGEPTQDPSVGTPTRSLLDRARQKIESPLVQRIVASSSGEALSGRQKSPLLSNTTLEVLRLIDYQQISLMINFPWRLVRYDSRLIPRRSTANVRAKHSREDPDLMLCTQFSSHCYSMESSGDHQTAFTGYTEVTVLVQKPWPVLRYPKACFQDHRGAAGVLTQAEARADEQKTSTIDPDEVQNKAFDESIVSESFQARIGRTQNAEPASATEIFIFFGPVQDRFALPENEPMHVLHSISRFQEATACTDKSTPGLWIAFLQAHLVGVESVIYLADILEQILLPYLSMCIPEHKRGITVVFREQSLLAARQLREPCALQTVPLLINLMLPSSGQGYSLGPMGSTSATIASLGKLWPLTTTGHSSSTSNRPDSAVVRTTTDTVESNPLVPLVRAVNWGSKQMATVPNAYINRIHSQVLTPFASGLQLTTQRFGLSEANRTMLWTKMLTCIADYLVNAYGHVHVCSEEGRGQMLLDVRSLRDLAESVCKIRPFPKLDHVIEYIQAFYIPAHEWEHWVTQTGIKFSKAQLIGLAHCLARGDRRLRQRLLNTVNQVYGNSASSNNNSSTNNANTNNNAIPALNYNATVLSGSMSTSTG